MTSMEDMRIPFHILEETTEEFANKHMIGSGGYGNVYKGVYKEEEIAVKLFQNVFDKTPFEKEYFNILRIQHPNVVRFVGYCYETQHKPVEHKGVLQFCQHIYRILCFELMQGGSLDKYLKESRDHDWPTCYNIIKGTCEGLNFLHGGSGSQILHLDLKPANILLDKDMRAKVADFGLARFFSKTQTHITNTIIGTEDYMPPEFKFKNQISPKNDVYSLGVIIIDILAGHTCYSEFREMDDVKPLIELVITNWRQWIYATTSPFRSAELDQVEACIKIAIKCVDPERKNRPTVAQILDNLQETEKKFHLLGQNLPTPTKSGPIGGAGGNICDIEEKPWRMTSLTIFCRGIIDAFSFSYIDQSWKKQHVGPWGADYIKQNNETICFGPSEFVEEVSGSYGSYRGIIRVISLTFVTNVRSYGPFGNPYHKNLAVLTHFRFMADEGSSIVGFHGRSGSYIDAIGVYMYPSNRNTTGALSVPLIINGESLPIPIKSGLRGGSGGGARDIKEKPWRLANFTICYGGLINAFSFSYIDQSGKRQHEGPWGKEDSNRKTETICFGPLEFVEEVSGAYGSRLQYTLVISLTFVTNVRTYGPFGNPYYKDWALTHFRFMAEEGSSIVGFHGRSGTRLDSIGVYMYPLNKTTVKALSVPVTLEGQCLPTLTKRGPWGGSGGDAQDINKKPWRLTSLTVSYKGLIDAFSFSYIDQAGKKQSIGPWGQGYHWDITKTIRFGHSEFLKEVFGAYGIHHGNIIVKFLTFVTNVETYGPFGTPDHPGPGVSATHFRFVAEEGSSIVGFYGRSGRYIDAIGVYTVRVT